MGVKSMEQGITDNGCGGLATWFELQQVREEGAKQQKTQLEIDESPNSVKTLMEIGKFQKKADVMVRNRIVEKKIR